MIQARIHSEETFGSSDGPGVRYLLFLKGCPLRCKYCHNPDTWADTEHTTSATAEEILARASRYKAYWGEDGGITVSGGEPLLQLPFLEELFSLAKEKGINTCIDTSGATFTTEEPYFSLLKRVIEKTDLLLLDIKHIDDEAHRALTGKSNRNILAFARWLSDIGKPVWIRHVLVPGINSAPEQLQRLADFIHSLSNVQRVEVLPYHTLGVFKWKALGLSYDLEDVPTPTDEEIRLANEILCQ